jgi:outer membrane biosynthesis protein TonB
MSLTNDDTITTNECKIYKVLETSPLERIKVFDLLKKFVDEQRADVDNSIVQHDSTTLTDIRTFANALIEGGNETDRSPIKASKVTTIKSEADGLDYDIVSTSNKRVKMELDAVVKVEYAEQNNRSQVHLAGREYSNKYEDNLDGTPQEDQDVTEEKVSKKKLKKEKKVKKESKKEKKQKQKESKKKKKKRKHRDDDEDVEQD